MKRRRRDSDRHSRQGKREDAAGASKHRPGSARSHSSCSSLAPDEPARDEDVSQTPLGKRRCARAAAPAADEARGKTPTSQPSQQEHRIESPPTGVREADSSTNPGVQAYDSNVPAALYTSQPFPIPAGDQNQYLKQARRLKRAADMEHDLTLKVIRYTQAVLYFLLTALSMEKDSDESEAMLAMLNDTLKLIKDMLRLSSATYRKQGKRPSHIDHKLQTLLLRCQGLIYLRMFKLKEAEHKKAQRQITDFKNQMLAESLTPDGCSYVIPRELFRLMVRCNDTQGHLRDWLDYWEQADQLMQPAPDTGKFFADIDRTMGDLLATSTLLQLVYYVRETTRRLQEMHSRAAV
ncbi:AF4/FMR2 family member 4-like [Pollicipes pollicipes]|uniref:AF4/FMR2 family member 4-like n=1 Tax=Pollicipes pollicipes TaxID=41117 RepID=UPI0018849116|nr:AF4/FMR2 family member 4-like [Pollicipes pollicipes]